VLNPPNALGSAIYANFGGPAFAFSYGSTTSVDVTLENFQVRGNGGSYPSSNGIVLENVADVTLQNMVISDFGTYNVWVKPGSYYVTMREVYSAGAGSDNFHIDGENCILDRCAADSAAYSAYFGSGGYDARVTNCIFEGATTAAVRVASGAINVMIDHCSLNMTAGGTGVISTAQKTKISNTKVHGNGSTLVGFDLSGIEYTVDNNLVLGVVTGMACTDGFGTISGNVFEGSTTGLEMTSTTYWATVTGNVVGGGTHSLRHVSGNKAMYFANRFDDTSGTFKAPTVVAGTPFIFGPESTTAQVLPTASLPSAGTANDGRVVIEDAGTGDRNLIIYAGGQRFRIDGGASF
jgi:hypothetical protein